MRRDPLGLIIFRGHNCRFLACIEYSGPIITIFAQNARVQRLYRHAKSCILRENLGGVQMELLYQDAQIAVCIKPQGVLSEAGPGSLPGLLQDALGGSIYPVHRLDRNVGGVMVYARTKAAAAALSRAIQDGGMAKEYLALIHGRPMGPEGVGGPPLERQGKKSCLCGPAHAQRGEGGQAGLPDAGSPGKFDLGSHPAVHRPEPSNSGSVCQPGISFSR